VHNPELGLHNMDSDEERDEFDSFWTPAYAVFALLERTSGWPPLIHEPACGAGHIARALRHVGYRVVATDLRTPALFGGGGVDFLTEKLDAQAIITNPPYRHLTRFLSRSLDLGVRKSAFLTPLHGLKGRGRYKIFSRASSVDVLPFTSGLRMWSQEQQAWRLGGAFTHAWIVLNMDGPKRPNTIQWIDITKHAPLDVHPELEDLL
jgi:hypothetical protein